MFDKDDGSCTYSCASPSDKISTVQSGEEKEVNKVIVSPEEKYYAFFDRLAEIPKTTLHTDFSHVNLDNFKPMSKSATATKDDLGQEKDFEWIYARFDAIAVDYFNKAIEPLRKFYVDKREEDIDQKHELDKDFHHGSERSKDHLQLVLEFLEPTKHFCSIYLAFGNTAENRKKFWEIFGEDGRWIGLELSSLGERVDVYSENEKEYKAPKRTEARLRAVYELTDKRINNLKHVISLDFAPDAHLGGPSTPKPTQTPLVPIEVLGKGQQQKKAKKPSFTVFQDPIPPIVGPPSTTNVKQQKDKQQRKALVLISGNIDNNPGINTTRI